MPKKHQTVRADIAGAEVLAGKIRKALVGLDDALLEADDRERRLKALGETRLTKARKAVYSAIGQSFVEEREEGR